MVTMVYLNELFVGQIEGAYMQGYGMFMMEQLVHSTTGKLDLNQGTYIHVSMFLDFNTQWPDFMYIE